MHYLSISTVFFTVLGYPMSYIEFFGTVFNIWCVYLTAKGKVLSWPIGMAGIVLYFFLFYQIRLYSDLLEQVYFFVMSIYGWWGRMP
jgi:nicotinamide mononucleotide transporter